MVTIQTINRKHIVTYRGKKYQFDSLRNAWQAVFQLREREKKEMEDTAIRSIAASICLQAVKDYIVATPAGKKKILNELRDPQIDFRTMGLSLITADQLERQPDDIAARLRRNNA